jgi:hypothetical protein
MKEAIMKRNILTIMTLIALTLFMSGCAKPAVSETPINGAEETAKMIGDLNDLSETLEKEHLNLFAKISKETFDAEKTRITEAIPHMTDAEFFYSLKQLIAMTGDSHTTINYSDSIYKHLMALPFAIEKYGDDWYLMMLDEMNAQYLGAKLKSINGVSIQDIYEKSKTLMSIENESWALSQFSNTIAFKEALNYLNIVSGDEKIMLKIETKEKLDTTIEMIPLTETALMNVEIDILEGKTVAKTWPEGYYRALSLDDDHLLIQYNVCAESPDLSMASFTDSIKKELTDKDYNSVVIDLRYNTGGNSEVLRPMLDMLKTVKDEKALEVYTLIGKSTFSSAIINAVQIKDELGSTLIGSATGGNVNGYGEVKTFELKNHPFVVTYSTKYFELIKGYDKGSLYPDVEVEQSLQDYLDGKDTEIEWILNN